MTRMDIALFEADGCMKAGLAVVVFILFGVCGLLFHTPACVNDKSVCQEVLGRNYDLEHFDEMVNICGQYLRTTVTGNHEAIRKHCVHSYFPSFSYATVDQCYQGYSRNELLLTAACIEEDK